MSQQKVPFEPIVPGKVGMYVCGPTTYAPAHIGHAYSAIAFDTVRRCLEFLGWDVTYVRNVTDIDDKIINRARETGEDPFAMSARFAADYNADMARFGVRAPTIEPKVTGHIPQIIGVIEKLIANGHAYAVDGDVYYEVRTFAPYGRLSKQNIADLEDGARISVDERKRAPADFALWKSAKPDEPHWPSLFGPGRPGWHIECSAMACRELGAPFDIHGGGWDLQFPHHENEIAQSEGALGRPFVNYWVHSAFLNIDHEKMSKSLGNFHTTREVLDKLDPAQGGEQLRFFLMRAHYRSTLNFTWDSLEDAGNALRGFYATLREVAPAPVAAIDWSQPFAARFREAMDDDFDTPIAFAVLHELRGEVNRSRSPELSGLLRALGGTLGLLQHDPAAFLQGGMQVDVQALIDERNAAKKAKDYPRADEIRRSLEAAGIALEDKPGGITEWRKK